MNQFSLSPDPDWYGMTDINFQQFMISVNPDEAEINRKLDDMIKQEFNFNSILKNKKNQIVPDLTSVNKKQMKKTKNKSKTTVKKNKNTKNKCEKVELQTS